MFLACCERGRPWISFSAGRSAHCGDSPRGHKSPRSVRSTWYADSRSCIVTFNRRIFSWAERMKHRKSSRLSRCNHPQQFSFIFIHQNKPRLVSRIFCRGLCLLLSVWSLRNVRKQRGTKQLVDDVVHQCNWLIVWARTIQQASLFLSCFADPRAGQRNALSAGVPQILWADAQCKCVGLIQTGGGGG